MSALPALLLFLLVHGVFFHDVVFDGRSLSAATFTAGLTPDGPVDAPSPRGVPHLLDVEGAAWVDEPSPYLASAAIAAGELPLWNPRSGLGAQLAANLNSGAGNPLQLPLDVWPSPLHADLFYLARLLLLALGCFLFLRELELAALAAFVGASVVAYGGYAMAWIAHHPLSSEIFLPFVLLGFERGRGGRAAGWVMLVASAAGSLLGGKLQASLLCFAFVVAYMWVRRAPIRGGRARTTVVAGGAGLALGGVLAAFLLVPASELMLRASGLTLGGRAQLASFTVPWSSLASLAAPLLYVAPGRAFADGFLTPAVGIGALALAAVGARAEGAPLRHVARFALAWAAVLLLRNVGAFGDLATRVPMLRGILFVKYTFTIGFALALAAAIGLDAIVGARIDAVRAWRAVVGVLVATTVCIAAAFATDVVPTHPYRLGVTVGMALALILALGAWRRGLVGRAGTGATFACVVLAELFCFAPHAHPPRIDPYRPPAYVDFLRGAAPGRIIGSPDVAVPLTSAAAGLADLRAIDVLTPESSYAFFIRLVSFCDRVIHFTVDPDLALAATSPALDLAGVRYVVSKGPLALDDLALRVRGQVGRERTARLLAGMRRFRTEGSLAIGPVALGDDQRFAFTLTTPFVLDVTGESEAAELAWGMLVRGSGAGVALTTRVDGVASDAAAEPETLATAETWQERHVALARAGEPRRVRLRLVGVSRDAAPARVSFGDLGFGPGAAVEARLGTERGARQAAEVAALREVFRDEALGIIVYENVNALPGVFRVGTVEPSASEDAALTRLGDGFDFRTKALVAKDDVLAVRAELGAEAARAGDGTATVRDATPNTLSIATDGPTPAVLVVSDLAFPGWNAAVDGRRVTVHTVDGLLRGVVVPAGAHRVDFRYRPTSLVVGVLLSLLAVAALAPYARISARLHRRGLDP